jgi:cell division protein FtsB
METWEIVVLAVVGVLLLLALGGGIANARRRRALAERFGPQIRAADQALAEAHASDKGWDRDALEAAARRELERARPGEVVRELVLVQVIDKPGQEEDQAVFRVAAADRDAVLTLGRAGDGWVLAGLD